MPDSDFVIIIFKKGRSLPSLPTTQEIISSLDKKMLEDKKASGWMQKDTTVHDVLDFSHPGESGISIDKKNPERIYFISRRFNNIKFLASMYASQLEEYDVEIWNNDKKNKSLEDNFKNAVKENGPLIAPVPPPPPLPPGAAGKLDTSKSLGLKKGEPAPSLQEELEAIIKSRAQRQVPLPSPKVGKTQDGPVPAATTRPPAEDPISATNTLDELDKLIASLEQRIPTPLMPVVKKEGPAPVLPTRRTPVAPMAPKSDATQPGESRVKLQVPQRISSADIKRQLAVLNYSLNAENGKWTLEKDISLPNIYQLTHKTLGTIKITVSDQSIEYQGKAPYTCFEALVADMKAHFPITEITEFKFQDKSIGKLIFDKTTNLVARQMQSDVRYQGLSEQTHLTTPGKLRIPTPFLKPNVPPTPKPNLPKPPTHLKRDTHPKPPTDADKVPVEVIVRPKDLPKPDASSTPGFDSSQDAPFKQLDGNYVLKALREKYPTPTWWMDNMRNKYVFENSDNEKITVEPIEEGHALRVRSLSAEKTAFTAIKSIVAAGKDIKDFKFTLTPNSLTQAKEMLKEYKNAEIAIHKINFTLAPNDPDHAHEMLKEYADLGINDEHIKFTLTANDTQHAEEMINEYVKNGISLEQFKSIKFLNGKPELKSNAEIQKEFQLFPGTSPAQMPKKTGPA